MGKHKKGPALLWQPVSFKVTLRLIKYDVSLIKSPPPTPSVPLPIPTDIKSPFAPYHTHDCWACVYVGQYCLLVVGLQFMTQYQSPTMCVYGPQTTGCSKALKRCKIFIYLRKESGFRAN